MDIENGPGHSIENPEERSIFPIPQSAADKAVERILSDPSGVASEAEGKITNAHILDDYLEHRLQGLNALGIVDSAAFTNGVFFTYTILEEAATAIHQKVPEVTGVTISSFKEDQSITQPKIEINPLDKLQQDIEKLADDDPAFGGAIKKLQQDTTSRRHFLDGAVTTYRLFKIADQGAREADQMNKQFGFEK